MSSAVLGALISLISRLRSRPRPPAVLSASLAGPSLRSATSSRTTNEGLHTTSFDRRERPPGWDKTSTPTFALPSSRFARVYPTWTTSLIP